MIVHVRLMGSPSCALDRMASWELAAACLLGIVDYVARHAEPHVEHEGINPDEEAGHGKV
jgi:hypothetical protein